MRKLAANYLVTETGIFLKNGIVVASDEGNALQFIDTKGDLREIALLSFHNGILMPGCAFIKTTAQIPVPEPEHSVRFVVLQFIAGQSQLSIQNLVESGKQVQSRFPEMKIPEIMNKISEVLLTNGGFSKEKIPGIFLLIGMDLVGLHFTPKSRLKKIF